MLAAEIGNRLPNLIKAKYAHLKFKWFKFQKEDWIFSWKNQDIKNGRKQNEKRRTL
jgi:hypothetical protein